MDLDTGRVVAARSDARGAFSAGLSPGLYGVDVGRAGYEIARGPRVVRVSAGEALEIALMVQPVQSPPPPAAGPRIVHEAIGCMAAEQNPEIEAIIEPAAGVAHPRVFFRSAKEPRFHYVEMIPDVGRFVACLPRPEADAGPVTYYVSAATVEAESRTADIVAAVVTDTGRCPAGSRVAPVCPCASPVAAFLPGGVASVPAGFSGVAGAVAGASTAANIAAAVAIGLGAVGIGILIGDTSPASASR